MKLLALRISYPDVLGELELSFTNDEGQARPLTLIYAGAGGGKTLLLSAIANTRPGHTVAMNLRPSDTLCSARGRWLLGMDEPDRPKPVSVASPNATELAVTDAAQRREAAFVERLAREGGFVFLSFSALRWFSKSPLLLASPERTTARYDVRGPANLDDASRNDLAREVKQALAYAAIVRVLPHADTERHCQLGEAMRAVVGQLSSLFGFAYQELDPHSLEPSFRTTDGRVLRFDQLPTAAKHAIAFAALPLTALWAAYPGMDPRRGEAVVVIDQLELHQEAPIASAILDVLLDALGEVQWIVTTRSNELLATRSNDETLALRRLSPREAVSVHSGRDSLVH